MRWARTGEPGPGSVVALHFQGSSSTTGSEKGPVKREEDRVEPGEGEPVRDHRCRGPTPHGPPGSGPYLRSLLGEVIWDVRYGRVAGPWPSLPIDPGSRRFYGQDPSSLGE